MSDQKTSPLVQIQKKKTVLQSDVKVSVVDPILEENRDKNLNIMIPASLHRKLAIAKLDGKIKSQDDGIILALNNIQF